MGVGVGVGGRGCDCHAHHSRLPLSFWLGGTGGQRSESTHKEGGGVGSLPCARFRSKKTSLPHGPAPASPPVDKKTAALPSPSPPSRRTLLRRLSLLDGRNLGPRRPAAAAVLRERERKKRRRPPRIGPRAALVSPRTARPSLSLSPRLTSSVDISSADRLVSTSMGGEGGVRGEGWKPKKKTEGPARGGGGVRASRVLAGPSLSPAGGEGPERKGGGGAMGEALPGALHTHTQQKRGK